MFSEAKGNPHKFQKRYSKRIAEKNKNRNPVPSAPPPLPPPPPPLPPPIISQGCNAHPKVMTSEFRVVS